MITVRKGVFHYHVKISAPTVFTIPKVKRVVWFVTQASVTEMIVICRIHLGQERFIYANIRQYVQSIYKLLIVIEFGVTILLHI